MIIDYSTSRPAMSVLRAAGVTAVGRYIGWDSVPGFPSIGKNISVAESKTILAVGISIFLAFEYVADAASHGTSQGTKDGILAKQQLSELDAPPSMAVYFAVDFDIPDYAPGLPDTPANALAKLGPVGNYFRAINALKYAYEIGAYGGYYAIKRLLDAGLITKAWQTIAWSGGMLDPRAVLYQTANTVPIAGGDYDIREHANTEDDFGQWPRPAVTPIPPIDPPIPQEADVAYPMVLDLAPNYSAVLPVPSGKTKLVIYADPGASQHGIVPAIRVGSAPKWATIELAPNWGTPSEWAFPVGTSYVTVGREDAGLTPVTIDFI